MRPPEYIAHCIQCIWRRAGDGRTIIYHNIYIQLVYVGLAQARPNDATHVRTTTVPRVLFRLDRGIDVGALSKI